VAAVDVITEYLGDFAGEHRRVASREWGLTLPAEAAGGWPLEVGLRISDGMLRAQAPVADFDESFDPWMLLWWNRQTRYVRFACTRSREIWVHGDLPVTAVDERALDRLLGLIVEGAVAVRGATGERTA
jgi:Putative bacterial sensory transduction regulator